MERKILIIDGDKDIHKFIKSELSYFSSELDPETSGGWGYNIFDEDTSAPSFTRACNFSHSERWAASMQRGGMMHSVSVCAESCPVAQRRTSTNCFSFSQLSSMNK